jgi:hypothetical protein
VNLTDHFTLEDLSHSDVAIRHGWDNIPSPEQVESLRRVAQYLEQVRAHARAVFSPHSVIIVTSGYRSPQVNEAVGSKPTSYHLKGLAADIRCPGVETLTLALMIHDRLTGYDQLINEYGSWVHVGLPEVGSAPRHQSLTIGGRPATTRTGLWEA